MQKRNFWDRLTGTLNMEEEIEQPRKHVVVSVKEDKKNNNWIEEENEEAELAVDVYQTPTEIIIQTMVAGVKPEDLELSIARDIVTIQGKREESRTINEDNYFSKELFGY